MNRKEKSPNLRALLAAHTQELRLERGLTQEQLAEMSGLHRTYVSHIERELANITLDNLQMLAEALKVPGTRLIEARPKK